MLNQQLLHARYGRTPLLGNGQVTRGDALIRSLPSEVRRLKS